MKQAAYVAETGEVIEWRDTEVFGYAEDLPAGLKLLELPDDFEFPEDAPRWVVNGALTTDAPPSPPAPAPRPPRVVSRRQGRRALLAAGLLDKVQLVIDALPDKQRAEAQIDWEDATEFDRDSELLQRLAPALGLDEVGLDELFAAAAGF